MKSVLISFLALLGLTSSNAFAVSQNSRYGVALSMAPKYDKNEGRWTPSTPEEGSEFGYGPTKTLLLHGPKPWFSRVFTPDDYDQAVLKFMAGEKCTREVAQGNMDRFLENAQDWAFERLEREKKGLPYPNYHILDTKQVILTSTWSVIIIGFFIVVGPKYIEIAQTAMN